MNKDIEVTFELLERLKSPRGGYSRLSLEVLGIKWPPPKGWRKELIRKAKESYEKTAAERTNMNDPYQQAKDLIEKAIREGFEAGYFDGYVDGDRDSKMNEFKQSHDPKFISARDKCWELYKKEKKI